MLWVAGVFGMTSYGKFFAFPVVLACAARLGWLIGTMDLHEIAVVLFLAAIVIASWVIAECSER